MVIARDGNTSWACATLLVAKNPPDMPIIVASAANDFAQYELFWNALPGVDGALNMVTLLIKKYLALSPERNIQDLK
jgi:hypothetical protein